MSMLNRMITFYFFYNDILKIVKKFSILSAHLKFVNVPYHFGKVHLLKFVMNFKICYEELYIVCDLFITKII